MSISQFNSYGFEFNSITGCRPRGKVREAGGRRRCGQYSFGLYSYGLGGRFEKLAAVVGAASIVLAYIVMASGKVREAGGRRRCGGRHGVEAHVHVRRARHLGVTAAAQPADDSVPSSHGCFGKAITTYGHNYIGP